jgi:hypothetical protein
MKTKYILLAVLAVLSTIAQAQEPGYFGKKTLIEFGAQGQLPLFQNLVTGEKGYIYTSGELQESYNLKDFSFRGSIGTIVSENAAMALEYSHHFYQVNPLRGGELNRQYVDTSGALIAQYIRPQVAFLDIQERVVMPKVIYSSFEGRVPAGLTQEIGIGYCMISITNREPQTAFSGTPDAETIRKQLVDPEVAELKGMAFMYGLRMNFPVTRSFLINVGVRYNYSWLFNKKGYRKMEQTEAWLSGREIWSRINQRRQLGIITFGIGGTIVL